VRVNGGTDITIEGNTANRGANGIDVRDSSKVVIRKNVTNKNSAHGIVLTNTSDSLIEANTVNDNVRWCTFPSNGRDVVVPGCDSAGIMLQDGSSRNKVRANTVLGQNGDGIFVRNHTGRCGDDTVIEKNKVSGAVWNGIEAGFCDRILISGNEFGRSRFGVWISYMDGVQILNNTFSEMEQAGVVLKNSHHGQIKNNVFSTSAEGIALIGDTDDEKFGWTMKRPFSYYRSYANVVTGNLFREIKGEKVRMEGSEKNVVVGNR
jgi:parallel beta-helix repeat protein